MMKSWLTTAMQWVKGRPNSPAQQCSLAERGGLVGEVAFLSDSGGWCGTATDLVVIINRAYGEQVFKSPSDLSYRVRGAVPHLITLGVDVIFYREGSGRRMIYIAPRMKAVKAA